MSKLVKRLCLGTAQFNGQYGVNARCLSKMDKLDILKFASDAGIKYIDTSSSYCDPSIFTVAGFKYITKIKNGDTLDTIKRMSNVGPLYAALAHEPLNNKTIDILLQAHSSGLTVKIGTSLYEPDYHQIFYLYDMDPRSIIQIPYNIFDNRFCEMMKMNKQYYEWHARSVFLQGALLMQHDSLPRHLSGLQRFLLAFRSRCNREGISSIAGCLTHVLRNPQIKLAVVGVNSVAELAEIMRSLDEINDPAFIDQDLLDPRTWPTQ